MPQTLNQDVWMYRDPALATSLSKQQIVGFDVESIDGSIGKIDDASFETDTGHIVVDTGPWIFGKKVVLPVGVLRNVDHENEKVFVNRTKDEIKNSPGFDETLIHDESYRTKLGSYYGPEGKGYRDF